MTSFSAMSLGSAAQIETKILSGEAASDDILSLYRFYCDRKDENNKQRVLTILKNKTLDTRRKPLFIHYGTPDIKVSDIKYECFIDKSVLEGTAKFDVFTLSNLLSLPSVTEVICTKKAAENCPALVDIIGGVCKELKKDFRQIGLERERERESLRLLAGAVHIREESFQKKLLLPTEITVPSIRGRCNIRCRFCEQAFLPIPYQEVRQEIFEQAMRVIPKAFIKTIITPYLEPLVSPRYLENYLKKGLELRPDLNIGINTNGSHLTREIAARLVDWQLKYINISLNLCDRDSYTWFTGKDFFDRVCEGIKLLYLERLRKRSKYPQIIVQFLNIPPVLGNEDALRAYWLQYADAVFFRNVSVPSALPDRVEKMKQELGEEFMEYEVELPRGWPCLSLFSTCSIDYEGNYIPCCPGMRASASVASGNEKSLVSSLVIGNIFEKDIATVWQGEELRRVRAMQVAGLLPICNTCRVNQANHKDLLNLRNAFYSHYYGETLA